MNHEFRLYHCHCEIPIKSGRSNPKFITRLLRRLKPPRNDNVAMFIMNKKWAKGQSLIEVLVALGIISIVTTALASVVITSMDNAQLSKNQNLALQYSQEGIEVVRQLRDQDIVAFRNYNTTFCLDKGSNTLASDCTSPNIDNFFLRKVTIEQSGCSANVASAVVAVSWADGKCSGSNTFCRSSTLETCLSTVNDVPVL